MSDNVPLTEELAMFQFEQVCRLRRLGVKFDAYLMDAFWYAPDGGYLEWRRDRWPHGPERWLEACEREGILPGLWFTANTAFHLEPPAAWRDSLAADGWGYSCSKGGFLDGFMAVLAHWYARGIRVFKFDFADFNASPAGMAASDAGEVRRGNVAAFRGALRAFREGHPEAELLAYNGFEHTEYMTWSDRPVRPVLDRAWLEVFDTVYCGDPRPADLPLASLWRSCDVYADAMVHLLHRGSGLGLREIDNCGFMIGRCGTCYRRGAEAWRTTALLSYARGGRVHVAMGNLEALTDEDARWLARVQGLYEAAGEPEWVGGNPGAGELYAYAAGGLLTVVNPGLEPRELVAGEEFRLACLDGLGELREGALRLGPGAVAVLARGSDAPDLGVGEGPRLSLAPMAVEWRRIEGGLEGVVPAPPEGDLHVGFTQRDAEGMAIRTSGGAPPDGVRSAALLRILATQDGREVPIRRQDDRPIWSGMSWAYGVIEGSTVRAGGPIHVRFESSEPKAAEFEGFALLGTPTINRRRR